MLTVLLTLIEDPDDREKFARIYSEYKEKMHREAMSILHNHALAEEAVQESLFRIARRISDVSPEKQSRTAAFIVIIVRNVSINMLRSEHTDEKLPLDENTCDITSDILGKTLSDEGCRELMAAVRGLDSIYSDVLILKIVYEYDMDEIAAMLGIPRRTAETRYYRGRKMIRDRLGERFGK